MGIKSLVDFTVDVVGEVTGNKYVGSFTVKTALSARDALKQDEIYRSVLGPNSQDANPVSKGIASAISYLATHVAKSPDWWQSVEGGLKLEDINVLAIVNNTAQDTIEIEYKKLAEEAKKAEDILKNLKE
jgi:hypothetical protein